MLDIYSIPNFMVVKWPTKVPALLLPLIESIYSIPGMVLFNFFPLNFLMHLIMVVLKNWLRNTEEKRKPFRKFHTFLAGTLPLKLVEMRNFATSY